MAWIESHQTLSRHPKVTRLCVSLNIPKSSAIGHMHMLWWWALDFAKDGNLDSFTDLEIATGAEWEGDPKQFCKALVECGWLNQARSLHDWDDYAGKYNTIRARNKQRMQANRERAANVQRTCDEQNATCRATGQDRTGQDRTEEKERAGCEIEIPPMTRKEFDALAEMRAVPKDCAEWFWNVNDGANWLDRNGRPIRKVEPLLLNARDSWRANKKPSGGSPQSIGGADKVIFSDELKRINDRLKSIADDYSSHQTISQKDGEKKAALNARKKEIMGILGLQF